MKIVINLNSGNNHLGIDCGKDRRLEILHINKDLSDRVIVNRKHAHKCFAQPDRFTGASDPFSYLPACRKESMKDLTLVWNNSCGGDLK